MPQKYEVTAPNGQKFEVTAPDGASQDDVMAYAQASFALPHLRAQESGNRPGVSGPMTKWGQAQGTTQLLPDTAKAMAAKLGVPWQPEMMTATTPEAAQYQDMLGQAYLQEGIRKTGNLADGLRYYHGGPDRAQWGPKTNAYADQVMARLTSGPAPAGGQRQAVAPPAQKTPARVSLAQMQKFAAGPQQQGVSKGSFWGDMGATLGDAWNKLASDVGQDYRIQTGRLGQKAPSLPQAVAQSAGDLGRLAGIVGDVGGLLVSPFNAPVQAAIVNPAARALAQHGPQAYEAQSTGFMRAMPRKLTQAQTEAAARNDIGTALSVARPAGVAPVAAPKPVPMSLEGVRAAKSAAYAQADQAGVQYTPQAFDGFVSDLTKTLVKERLNPRRHPNAASMLEEIQGMQGASPSLTEMDQLRQVIDRDVVGAADASDRRLGKLMRNQLDAFMDNAKPTDVVSGDPAAFGILKQARELNTRVKKMEAVTDAVESADLRASSTYAGGNKENAVRQNLRPLLDPRSAKRIQNLTKDERAALNTAVRGSAPQNAVRVAGKLLDPRGLLGSVIQTGMHVGSHGVSLASIPLGMAATEAGKAFTGRNVQNLIDLMSVGGFRPGSSLGPYVPQPVSILSAPGAAGVLEATRPLLPESDSRLKTRARRATKSRR